MTGLYPPESKRAHGSNGQFTIFTRSHDEENLVWNPFTCPRMKAIEREWRESSQAKQIYAELEDLLKSSHYREVTWHELFSTVEALYLSGHELPPGISANDFDLIRRNTEIEAQNWPGNAEVASLSLGSWLHELLEVWDSRKPQTHHVQIFSAHDHTIVPLLRILGLNVFHPNMASALIFEIYRESASGHRYIHILLNGEALELPLPNHFSDHHMFAYEDFCQLVEPSLIRSREQYFDLCQGVDKYTGHHPKD